MNHKKSLLISGAISLLLMSVSALAVNLNKERNSIEANAYTVTTDISTYYSSISTNKEGTALLSELRDLNSSKKKTNVGYSSMGTSPSGQFKYTDYDPSTVKYDSNGQPYGTKLITFYSGNSASSGMNREHVWPDSHGGNKVENDIHMPRPTLSGENGSRGNSFYVEGSCDNENGWDPAEESFGIESYRGDSARIIFYCVVANSNLSLLDANYHATSRKNNDNMMGKLSDLLKWNLEYPVLQREQNRNNGAEYLQGNRNPFIDHPEYACKIWGSTNDATKKICNGSYTPIVLESLTMNISNKTLTSGDAVQLSVTASPSEASNSVTWSSSDSTIASVSSSGLVSAKDKVGTVTITATSNENSAIFATCEITVKEKENINISEVYASNISMSIGEEKDINAKYLPSDAYPTPSFTYEIIDPTIASVTSNGKIKGLKEGSTKLKIVGTQKDITKEAIIDVNVTEAVDIEDTIVPSDLNGYGTDVEYKTSNGLTYKCTNVGNYNSKIQFKKSSGVMYSTTSTNLKSITLNNSTALSVYGLNSLSDSGTKITSTSNTYDLSGYSYFKIKNENSSATTLSSITIKYGGKSTENIDSVTLNKESLSLKIGESETLTATSNGDVTWTSSNPNVASVNNGKVIAISEGEALITATSGKANAICRVKVLPLDNVSLEEHEITLYVGETHELKANSTGSLIWTSNDESIAKVNNGLVAAIKVGETTIIVKCGNAVDSCLVKVLEKAIEPNEPDQDENNKNNGCGGNITTTSILLSSIALFGLILLLLTKKKAI